MEIYLPTLEEKMRALGVAFRFIVFAIMVAGFVFTMSSSRTSGVALFKPFLKALVIVAAIAYLDVWMQKTEWAFLAIADYVDPGYSEHPTSTANAVRESTADNPEGQEWSWRHLNESIYQAVSHALANTFIYVGTLITVPMLILQYVLRWLLYLVAPFVLAVFMVPGLGALGVRFLQQLLAILAWPIGFAITNLVALAVWTDFRNAVGANPQSLGDALYSPLLTAMGGILATIVIIVGMVSTPIVMQMLFAQGHAFTGESANPVRIVRSGASSIYGLGDRLLSRGATPLAAPASAPSRPARPISPASPSGI